MQTGNEYSPTVYLSRVNAWDRSVGGAASSGTAPMRRSQRELENWCSRVSPPKEASSAQPNPLSFLSAGGSPVAYRWLLDCRFEHLATNLAIGVGKRSRQLGLEGCAAFVIRDARIGASGQKSFDMPVAAHIGGMHPIGTTTTRAPPSGARYWRLLCWTGLEPNRFPK